ncbi:hypothetical protein [Woodsholea maritima]|uniref:hypothetical protein n=1 Tax=Woodsholea maritima TaxID=240237 RepID=UPI0003722BF7|nr:hypothetical protein [Woodsholea maritima]
MTKAGAQGRIAQKIIGLALIIASLGLGSASWAQGNGEGVYRVDTPHESFTMRRLADGRYEDTLGRTGSWTVHGGRTLCILVSSASQPRELELCTPFEPLGVGQSRQTTGLSVDGEAYTITRVE